jgi:cell filamentation protein
MSYSIDAITDGCYENTTCLVNKFDIRDEEQLKQAEADITFAKATLLESNPISDKFDLEHYMAIHKFLFEDIYDWAGKFRTVNISKKGTSFCSADQLETTASNCFKRLLDNDLFSNLDREEFVDAIVDFYCSTNMLHPFREGNGRTQRIFIAQLIRYNGYDFDFSDIDPDDLMIATIQSANGVTDFLKQLFDENISK